MMKMMKMIYVYVYIEGFSHKNESLATVHEYRDH